jgi:starvation-inducible DNA-binding protein
MKVNIGLSEKNLNSSINLLITVLASEMMLYTKTRKFHWNVAGESFMELHKLFESQYKELEFIIDEVAERIGKLGHQAPGSMNEFIKHSILKENAKQNNNSKQLLTELLNDHETLIIELRKNINATASNKDAGTADFFTGLLKQHETIAWILRRYNH